MPEGINDILNTDPVDRDVALGAQVEVFSPRVRALIAFYDTFRA
jgi:hypothetical protein